MSETSNELEASASGPADLVTTEPVPIRKAAYSGPLPTVAGNLYSVVWRWHFYAGLISAPILWVVTVTGALYVFRTELTA